MSIFVLVHGGNMSTDTWNRLRNRNDYSPGGHLGAKYWDGTKRYLESHGHAVSAPTLPDEHTHNLTDHITGICRLIECQDLSEIILAGHSYGGMVITGVADRMPGRIRRLVYIDAALPDPDESLFDLFFAGGFDPRSFTGLEAAAAYVEKLRYEPRKIAGIPRTYILCTKSEFAGVTRIAQEKIARKPDGWMYRELPTSHVPMATMQGRFYRIMLEMANR